MAFDLKEFGKEIAMNLKKIFGATWGGLLLLCLFFVIHYVLLFFHIPFTYEHSILLTPFILEFITAMYLIYSATRVTKDAFYGLLGTIFFAIASPLLFFLLLLPHIIITGSNSAGNVLMLGFIIFIYSPLICGIFVLSGVICTWVASVIMKKS